jgi:outer membrane protein assembly factor BamA
VAYINREHRWNLGVAAQRIPYIASQYGQDLNTGTVQRLTYRLFDNSISGIAQYPFSQVQRVDFSLGARRIAQDVRLEEFAPGGGYAEEVMDLPSYNLGEGSAALVYDNSLFGYTSPFAGQRYRFEVAPTIGTLRFTQLTADYRKYFFLRPLTFAVRGWHFGRYGRDEAQLSPIYAGNAQIMRGYSQGDVVDGCIAQLDARIPESSASECQVLRELVGSRFTVANAELRFPLIRQIVVGGGLGLPPIEGIAFFDAGTSYGDVQERTVDNQIAIVETRPNFKRGVAPGNDRGIFTSGGVGARVNLFGYAVLEGVYVNAFERSRGWHWQFSLQPGF